MNADRKPESDPLLSANELGKRLRVSGRCVLQWFYDDIIPAAIHVGRVIRFCEADVLAALQVAGEKSQKKVPKAASVPPPARTVRIALSWVARDVAKMPKWLAPLEPTAREQSDAAMLAAKYFFEIKNLTTAVERVAYLKRVLDSVEKMRKLPAPPAHEPPKPKPAKPAKAGSGSGDRRLAATKKAGKTPRAPRKPPKKGKP